MRFSIAACLGLVAITAACRRPVFDRGAPGSGAVDALAPVVTRWPLVRTSAFDRFERGVESVVVSLTKPAGGTCVWRFAAGDDATAWLDIEEPCQGFETVPWAVGGAVWVSSSRGQRGSVTEVLGLESAGGASQDRPLLYAFVADPTFPFEIRTNLVVEFGAGLEQRVATEVFARSDGCSFVWNHGSLGFVTTEAAAWVAPGEDKLVRTPHGTAFRARAFAVVRAIGTQEARCDGGGSVRFRVLAVDVDDP